MATIDTTRATFVTVGFIGRVFSFITDIAASVIAWNDARVTRNALSGLTDRELEDIGLTRADIDYVAESNFIR